MERPLGAFDFQYYDYDTLTVSYGFWRPSHSIVGTSFWCFPTSNVSTNFTDSGLLSTSLRISNFS